MKIPPGNSSALKKDWIRLNTRVNHKPLRILSEEDWKFWVSNGYVVIKNAVPREHAERVVKLLWEFEEKDPDNPDTWYKPARRQIKMEELVNTGMVELYNHQYLWDNRQFPKVHKAFADIWGTEKLWVSIDRANLNFPIRPGYEYKGFIHWDYDPETNPQSVQGVLALDDQTDENMGGFQCVPELFRTYDTWKKTQPENRDRFKPDVTGFEIVKVPLEARDLLIFNSRLPHGIRPNTIRDKVRIAQYIAMLPAEEQNEQLRNWRISSWKNRLPPQGDAFPGDPRKWEQKKYKAAELSSLGKKLLGLEMW